MKKHIVLRLFLFIGIIFFSIVIWWLMFKYNRKPVQTIENMRFIYERDLNNFVKYQGFARESFYKDSLIKVSALFYAISLSDLAHSNIAKKYLKDNGVDTIFKKADFAIKKLNKNIEEAIRYEKYDVETMYPQFIRTARNENADSVELVLLKMFEVDKNQLKLLQLALDCLKKADYNSLSDGYYICSSCGYIEYANQPIKTCKICNSTDLKLMDKTKILQNL